MWTLCHRLQEGLKPSMCLDYIGFWKDGEKIIKTRIHEWNILEEENDLSNQEIGKIGPLKKENL